MLHKKLCLFRGSFIWFTVWPWSCCLFVCSVGFIPDKFIESGYKTQIPFSYTLVVWRNPSEYRECEETWPCLLLPGDRAIRWLGGEWNKCFWRRQYGSGGGLDNRPSFAGWGRQSYVIVRIRIKWPPVWLLAKLANPGGNGRRADIFPHSLLWY